MNDIREALDKLLREDPVLEGLATAGVWFESADENDTDTPEDAVVIFSQMDGTIEYTFGDDTNFQKWDVKGVGPSKAAGEIDARCRAILSDAKLAIVGRETLFLLPMQDINYREQTDGETYQHVGATYSITTERTT